MRYVARRRRSRSWRISRQQLLAAWVITLLVLGTMAAATENEEGRDVATGSTSGDAGRSGAAAGSAPIDGGAHQEPAATNELPAPEVAPPLQPALTAGTQPPTVATTTRPAATTTPNTTAPPPRTSPSPPPTTAAPAPRTSPPAVVAPRHESVVSYLEGGSVGEVVVPNGVYRGGTVSAPRAKWLVLRAESPGGVIVDLRETGLRLEEGTNKVVFVGFTFRNGMVRLAGVQDVHFWYCDFSFPAEEWFRQYRASGGSARASRSERSRLIADMANPLPTPLRARAGVHTSRANVRIGVHGSDVHDVGDDGIFLDRTTGGRLEGLRVWNIDEKTYDPGQSFGSTGDWFHNDSIQAVGPTSEVAVTDSWLGQKLQWGTSGGTLADARFERLWLAGSDTFGMLANIGDGGRILNSRQSHIRAFGNGQGNGSYQPARDRFRTDVVNGEQRAVWPHQHHDPGTFELRASDVTTDVPAGITIRNGLLTDLVQVRNHPANPANQWRAAHPYNTWAHHLGI